MTDLYNQPPTWLDFGDEEILAWLLAYKEVKEAKAGRIELIEELENYEIITPMPVPTATPQPTY